MSDPVCDAVPDTSTDAGFLRWLAERLVRDGEVKAVSPYDRIVLPDRLRKIADTLGD